MSQISRLLWEPVFKFCIHRESGQVYCGKESQDAEINFCLFPFFLFSIFYSNVIHREICVKDFSGTTAPRILKFGTNVGYDLLQCVRENQSPDAYHFLYLSIFLSLQIFYYRFLGFYESQSLQISYTPWEWPNQVYCGTENHDAEIYFYHLFPFFLFSISHSTVIHREICVKDFSGTTGPRILKFGTNVGYDLLYCVKENQPAAAYHSLYLLIFLTLQ